MPDQTLSTLEQIRIKIRRLTRSVSVAQLTDQSIDDYVNTFVLYDFPEHLRLFSLRTTFSFYTKPFIDVYENNTTDVTDPLYNFKNKYVSIHPPIYIAGYNSFFSQSREQFFGIYPKITNIASIGTAGDGITTAYTGTITATPFLQNNVLFSSIDINGNGLSLIDVPVNSTTGNLVVPNQAIVRGLVDYVTGEFAFVFPTAPAQAAPINSQTVPYVPSIPQALLYYDDKFTIRPVPNQPYKIDMEAYIRPTELLNAADQPQLAQWWQYIAYGAAKKIFEDRSDLDSVSVILPEYKKQELLVLRRTIVQQSNERTATIYTESLGGIPGGGFGWGGGSF